MISRSRFDFGMFQFCLLLLLFALFSSCSKELSTDEKAVIEVVEQFFQGLSAKDSTALRGAMLPHGTISSVREIDGRRVVRYQEYEQFFENIAMEENDFLERMWEPMVLINGDVAMLWTPYDFYFNGSFSHCGIDAFNLLKTDAGWKIAGTVYSVVKTGCEESPLYPPEFPETHRD
jgi:hypothetical protein